LLLTLAWADRLLVALGGVGVGPVAHALTYWLDRELGWPADGQACGVDCGVLLVAVGLRRAGAAPKPKAPTTDSNPPSIGRSFLAGAGGMASNLTTFALYTPALALIAGSGLLLRQQGLAALIILLITSWTAGRQPGSSR
jgi:hypothetical protein